MKKLVLQLELQLELLWDNQLVHVWELMSETELEYQSENLWGSQWVAVLENQWVIL